DLVRAKARLELLKDPDPYQALAGQAQRALADGSSTAEARALGLLSLALGQARSLSATPLAPSPAISPTLPPPALVTGTLTATLPSQAPPGAFLPAPGTPTPGTQPAPEISPTPAERIGLAVSLTVTPASVALALKATGSSPAGKASPTPGAPFVLSKRELACPQNLSEPLIQVQAYDAAGKPVPGVEVIITWAGGAERFFTGLKSDQGPGYGDFTMASGITYTVQLGESGQPAGDLAAAECAASGPQRQWGSWVLSFKQP
ncbi:MAG TPA: hypothetical protein VF498_07815, partial [Anaerolineales bacterium]